METERVLTERFRKAIKKSLNPCPLIGQKWFRFYSTGKPADFEFIGTNKLAKASKKPAQRLAETIVRNLDLGEIPAQIRITSEFVILVNIEKPSAVQDA